MNRSALFLIPLFALGVLLSGCGPKAEAQHGAAPAKQVSSVKATVKVGTNHSGQKRRSSAPRVSSWSSRSVVPLKDLEIPILVYHHVRKQEGWGKDTWSYKMTVSPDVFEKQMQWIADHGYTSVNMDTAVALLKGTVNTPTKPIVITFDDNNLSQYDLAVPIMEKHGLIGVFYQVTDRLDTKGTLDRAKTLELHKRGHDIESHTLAHRALTGLSPKEAQRDLAESKRVLEELLGKPVLHVAYPGTAHNQAVRDAAKAAGYVTGTLMDPRRAVPKDDLFKLPRIMMIDTTDLAKVLP